MLPQAKMGLGGTGGDNFWKVSYDRSLNQITIGYGTMFYNGKFFTTNNILSGSSPTGIGTNNTVFLFAENLYIYLYIFNPLSLPSETTEDLRIKIDIQVHTTTPETINEDAPSIQYIPLAFVQVVNNIQTVYDLRPKFMVTNFSILA